MKAVPGPVAAAAWPSRLLDPSPGCTTTRELAESAAKEMKKLGLL